jgi:hypothetical protein
MENIADEKLIDFYTTYQLQSPASILSNPLTLLQLHFCHTVRMGRIEANLFAIYNNSNFAVKIQCCRGQTLNPSSALILSCCKTE